MFDYVSDLYSQFYSKIYGFEYYLPPTERNQTVFRSFQKFIKKQNVVVGKSFFLEFTTFQFQRYSKMNLENMRKIQFNWIVGKKGWGFWKNRNEFTIYWNNQFRKKLGISVIEPFQYNLSPEFKKQQRTINYNSETGFLNCAELNLYDSKTKECMFCKFKRDCQKLHKNA
jgi:hypothetical protein